MATTRLNRKLIRVSVITLGILAILTVSFHFWFKAHARQMIEDLVHSKSNGKLKLQVDRFSFNWLTKKLEFKNAVFYSTDTVEANTSYRFRVDLIRLKVEAILPIVFRKSIVIDSMTLLSPEIEVTRHKANEKKPNKNVDVSIPEEMGKVYNSIQDALRVLKVTKFLIDDGKFTLINKIIPDQQPLSISNIRFQVDNLQVDTTIEGAKEKILFSDNVMLQSKGQQIIFPDGRHKLSFSRFRINLQNKLVEFDSCTISATREDSSAASFTIFMDALKLIDIDFDMLYNHEVIKADSVYCINPRFILEVELGMKKENKPAPKLENIIKGLFGDMQLDHVVVSNADFNIKTIRNGIPNSFTFSKNNFEMTGLTVDQQAVQPVKVRSFAMAIRNYENFLKDSSYSVQFDSVLFRDDRIFLSNFIFHKLDKGRIINTFNIPEFYLGGLSWDDLVFEKRLKAHQATMFNPYISYTMSAKKKSSRGKQDVFASLSEVNDYMDLNFLDIINGSIDLKVNKNVRIQLESATLAIQSHDLLTSTKLAGIKRSLTKMDFKKGIIKAGSLTLQLHDIHYIGESGKFQAAYIDVKNQQNKMAITLNDVAVEKMLVDEITGNIISENIKWSKGAIKLSGGGKGGDMSSKLQLKNVSGKNTSISSMAGSGRFSTHINDISFDQLEKIPGKNLFISGLSVNGRDLRLDQPTGKLSVKSYSVVDKVKASLTQLAYNKNSEKLKAEINIPSLTLVPDINSLLKGDMNLAGVQVNKPVINIHTTGKSDGEMKLPGIDISDLTLSQPRIHFTKQTDSGMLSLQWKGVNASDFLRIRGLHMSDQPNSPTTVDNISFYLTDMLFAHPSGKSFDARDGKISAELNRISLDPITGGRWDWKGTLSNFEARDFVLDSIGKKKGRLVIKSVDLKDLGIGSASLVNMQKLAAANEAFQIKKFNGSYADSTSEMRWFNAGLTRNNKELTLDSFIYSPTLDKDSFMARQSYQTDYIKMSTGSIRMGPVDLDTYIKDNILNTGTVVIDNAYLSDYRDNTLPFKSGVTKPLPVDMLRKIPQALFIDTIRFTNARVDYTQLGIKTSEAATIPITRMNVQMTNVRNYDLSPTDSLDILATAFVLDSAWVRLRMKQSYTDSLSGFLMTARFRPVDLGVFNPVLVPLASVKIESGYLDTASLTAVGLNEFSYGEMNMVYHDLKLKFLKDGDETKKSLLKGVMSFIVNTLVRNKNETRTGTIFQARDKDRSAINYLVKIAMSGFASSVGVKSNKKKMRKFKKDMDKKNLPPVRFE